MTNVSILAYYNPDDKLTLQADSSKVGIAAVLLQQGKQRRSQGGAEGAQALPLAIRILMFIFLVIHQHCKS